MKDEFFDDEMVENVARHMNRDHADACLMIAQALGSLPSATSAAMLGMDAEGVDFIASSASGTEIPTRVAFTKPLSHAGQIRGHLVALTRRARAIRDE